MIVWIASYPKSGNTWVRSLISAYLYSDKGVFNFELLKNIKEFPRQYFERHVDLEKFQTISKESAEWLKGQKLMDNNKDVTFLKTHSCICTVDGNGFTSKENTIGAIYVVRDPRNVISSLSNHFNLSIEDSLKWMTNAENILRASRFKKKWGFTFISDWKTHYISWKKMENFFPIKIIRYEDLQNLTRETFVEILKFLNKFKKIEINENKITNTINSTNFKELKLLEEKFGFNEARDWGVKNFFNLGKDNNWKKLLEEEIIKKLNKNFFQEMKELGYN